jgi:hypothetical protein
MISIIFRYYDKDGEEKLSIGSIDYFKQKVKTSKQLVERLAWEHNNERRETLRDMTQEQIVDVLTNTLQSDVLHTFHPN